MEINSLKRKNDIQDLSNKVEKIQGSFNRCSAIWITLDDPITLTKDVLVTTRLTNVRKMVGNDFSTYIEPDGSYIVCKANGIVAISCEVATNSRSGYIQILLYKNGAYIGSSAMGTTNVSYGCQNLPLKIVSVQNGDKLSMRVKSDITGDKISADERTGITAFYIHFDDID